VALFASDPAIGSVAYPLRASNRNFVLARFQDFEYLAAGYAKLAQAAVATTMFASGAINSWRLPLLVDILFRHNTAFHGEDLQLALIMHGLRGKRWVLPPLTPGASPVHMISYRVVVEPFAVTGTDVPVHWFHAEDVWRPGPLGRYVPDMRRPRGWG
jgi:hypothetical protein